MALTFPTIAEQVIKTFLSTTKTTSLATLAEQRGGERDDGWNEIIFRFDDDTSLHITGRGRAHKFWTELP